MKKIYIKTTLTLLAILFVFSRQVFAAQPVADVRLNTSLNQTNNSTLSLNSIKLEDGPSVGYQVNFTSNYYLIKIIDKNNTELFSGKAPKGIDSTILNPLNLYLPYFNEATKVRLLDESGTLKLEIDLATNKLVGLKYNYAQCDLCGYCQGDKPPSNWENCRKCLYPNANPTPTIGDTLKITDASTSATGPTTFPNKTYNSLGCMDSTPGGSTQAVLNFIITLAGGIAFVILLYGAFVIATSQSEAERLNYGRKLVKGAIIGLIVTLLSAFLVRFIASGILRIPGFG